MTDKFRWVSTEQITFYLLYYKRMANITKECEKLLISTKLPPPLTDFQGPIDNTDFTIPGLKP